MVTKNEGYIIEFVPMGNSVKVSAMDPVSLIEVSIIGPMTASREELQRNVINKLIYVMKKGQGPSDDGTSGQTGGGGSSCGGIIV